ncbi:MAG: NAD(P)/FAD-dependent oxidoreductase [Solirubrobacteraceae bacterium]
MTDHVHERKRVVIVGGGVAALEAVLALHELAGHVVDLTLVAPDAEFLYGPVTVAEAFDRGEARSYSIAELVAKRVGGRIVTSTLQEVLVDEQMIVTVDDERIPYEALVIATGAVMTEALPGALTFRGRRDVAALREVLEALVDGSAKSVAFTFTSGRTWTLPLYELAILTAAFVQDHGADAKVYLVTPEEEPLELFGSSEAIAKMLADRGVSVRTSSLASKVTDHTLVLAGGGKVYADRVVTVPQLEGPRIAGLPADTHGFIPVDAHGRVIDAPGVYAAGDATAFPLKQGGLAAQQADAVAEAIAADAGVPLTPSPFVPVLRGLLLTGGAPIYLRSEPQHLKRPSSVAIEASSARWAARDASLSGSQALWWPPAKIAGRYLAPYLATARPDMLHQEQLTDRVALPETPVSEAEHAEAVELALLLAECDAQWGDYRSALDALDAAEALQGTLPAEFEAKRRAWREAHRLGE